MKKNMERQKCKQCTFEFGVEINVNTYALNKKNKRCVP